MKYLIATLLFALALLLSTPAHSFDASGVWLDPAEEGHYFHITQFVADGQAKAVVTRVRNGGLGSVFATTTLFDEFAFSGAFAREGNVNDPEPTGPVAQNWLRVVSASCGTLRIEVVERIPGDDEGRLIANVELQRLSPGC